MKFYVGEYTKACRAQEQALDQPRPKRSSKLAQVEQQIAELEQMLRDGRLSPAIAGAALDQARSERAAIIAADSNAGDRQLAKVIRVFPKAAEELNEQVKTLESELADPEIVQRARPIVHRLCGGKVPVTPDPTGKYLIAEVTWNAAPLLMAAGAGNSVWNGSGGPLWIGSRWVLLQKSRG